MSQGDCPPDSAHQGSLVAVHAADVLDVLKAHLLDHGGGLSRAGAALAVDVERRFDVADMIDNEMNAVQRDIDAAFDMTGLVFGAGSYVYEVGAGIVPVFLDGGVDVGPVKQI